MLNRLGCRGAAELDESVPCRGARGKDANMCLDHVCATGTCEGSPPVYIISKYSSLQGSFTDADPDL